jgi:hypothetical protein
LHSLRSFITCSAASCFHSYSRSCFFSTTVGYNLFLSLKLTRACWAPFRSHNCAQNSTSRVWTIANWCVWNTPYITITCTDVLKRKIQYHNLSRYTLFILTLITVSFTIKVIFVSAFSLRDMLWTICPYIFVTWPHYASCIDRYGRTNFNNVVKCLNWIRSMVILM